MDHQLQQLRTSAKRLTSGTLASAVSPGNAASAAACGC